MDLGLVGAGILSGVLGAHLITVIRDRASLGAWIDSLIGALGGGVGGQLAVLASVDWANDTAALAVGRIAAVILAALLGGSGLLFVVGMFRSRTAGTPGDQEQTRSSPDRRTANSDRRKGERRVPPRD